MSKCSSMISPDTKQRGWIWTIRRRFTGKKTNWKVKVSKMSSSK